MIAKELGRFFWDVDPGSLDPSRHKTYIIERLLELGDETAVRWLFGTYHKKDIIAVLRASRSLSPKSRNFWRIRLDEPDHD
ncbi:MAG: hypothetical protein Q8O91_03450 [Candidatus Aminicenantes bacterium]|nr:hypothetical protein [Candidatus Aminicenantes bacterium]